MQKRKNSEPRPKFTNSYKKRKSVYSPTQKKKLFKNSLAELKPGFYMSGKSQMIGDFVVSRPSRTFSTFVDVLRSSRMVGDRSGKWKLFLFPV